MFQYEVHRIAEHAAAAAGPRGAHDDDLTLASRCFVDDGATGVAHADLPLAYL
jgi:hypothetical protein